MKNKIIFIVGPTASGKTEQAIRLAEGIGGEIISADSMQAYKNMGILSQSPTPGQQRKITHHLVNFLTPRNEYSAALFSQLAEEKIQSIIKKGKIPIVVGGSGLYIKALVDGIFPAKGKNEALRKSLRNLANQKGAHFLHKRLKRIDPSSAEKIHPNDLKRIIRAIEIYEIEKKTKTNLESETKGLKDKYDVRIFGLVMHRKKLYERIEKRVDLMFRKGVVKEVKSLLGKKPSITSRQALGVKEIEGYLNKIYDKEKAKELLKRRTRRFAKRQLTWFRGDRRIVWVNEGEDVPVRKG